MNSLESPRDTVKCWRHRRLSNVTHPQISPCWWLHVSYALNLISTFLLLSLGRYLFWWTVNPTGYHSRRFGTDMAY